MTPEQVELEAMGFKIPDSLIPIVACRSWRIASHGGGVKLISHNGTLWTPGEAMKATCNCATNVTTYHERLISHYSHGEDSTPADVPLKWCTCGVYAAKHEDADALVPTLPYYVHGEVYMWGKIIEGHRGYRSEFAYPKRFFATSEEQRVLLESMGFGVPVIGVKEVASFRFPFPKEEVPTAIAKRRRGSSPVPTVQLLSAIPALLVGIVDAFTLDMSRAFNQVLVALMLAVGAVAASLSIYLFHLRKKTQRIERMIGMSNVIRISDLPPTKRWTQVRKAGRQRR